LVIVCIATINPICQCFLKDYLQCRDIIPKIVGVELVWYNTGMSTENKPGFARRMMDIPEYVGMTAGVGMVLLSPFYPPFLLTGLEIFTLSGTSYVVTENIAPKNKN